MDTARTWVLLYSRMGDNSQAMALAQSLGLPFETKSLAYNWLRRFGLRLGPTFATLTRSSREALRAPWPDLVISIGRWSVPVARAIKEASGGRTKLVFLGNPRVDPAHFDLVFTTRDYLEPRGSNVVIMPMPLATGGPDERAGSAGWASSLPAPRTLLLIGAPIKYWALTADKVAATVRELAEKANAAGGSLLVSGSPRTPHALLIAAQSALATAEHRWMAASRKGGLADMLAAADEVMVTGDSMSMVTEAVLSGKPVGLVPLDLDERGARKLGAAAAAEGSGSRRRDMRRFWGDLWNQGLVGTVTTPKAAAASGSANAAAALAVTSLINAPPPTVSLEQSRRWDNWTTVSSPVSARWSP